MRVQFSKLLPGSGFVLMALILLLSSCSSQRRTPQAAMSAETRLLNTAALQAAHIGISVLDPETNTYLYNYQGDKYFVPASNIKIPTCYAAMKYLGDSLVGLRYSIVMDTAGAKRILVIQPTADPSFLHPDYARQPVWDLLTNEARQRSSFAIMDTAWKDERWGSGWSWSDYDAAYMAERSPFPIFGNCINIKLNRVSNRQGKDTSASVPHQPYLLVSGIKYFDDELNLQILSSKEKLMTATPLIQISRELAANRFTITDNDKPFTSTVMPFVTNGHQTTVDIIKESLGTKFGKVWPEKKPPLYRYAASEQEPLQLSIDQWTVLHTQPTDSLLRPMMHRSDNFFAEQSLLMVSNEKLGIMNAAAIIDTILKTDFKYLPQKPRWVDGSGLSRYNLFTPQDMVAILGMMKKEFGMERVKTIFPTGGEGTLNNYYLADKEFIYAKTGSLSGVLCISGYLITTKGKTLIFSVLVNNHQASTAEIRRAVEQYLHELRITH